MTMTGDGDYISITRPNGTTQVSSTGPAAGNFAAALATFDHVKAVSLAANSDELGRALQHDFGAVFYGPSKTTTTPTTPGGGPKGGTGTSSDAPATQTGGGAAGAPPSGVGHGPSGGCGCDGPWYRALRPGEDWSNGLSPKDPTNRVTPYNHVANGSRTGWAGQFISFTKSASVALAKYAKEISRG